MEALDEVAAAVRRGAVLGDHEQKLLAGGVREVPR
jgi:hypothetical protein